MKGLAIFLSLRVVTYCVQWERVSGECYTIALKLVLPWLQGLEIGSCFKRMVSDCIRIA